MRTIRTIAQMQELSARAQALGQSIGFVPTMGALHEGHLALVRRARQENDLVVVSIFINPLQFGPKEDYRRYPRTLARDGALLKREKVHLLFAPSVQEMVPAGFATTVDVPSLTGTLCGQFRPGHFRGVATVVARLFGLVRPKRAYFGEKDYQQVQVIRRMVEDLAMPVQVIAHPTVREADGLALSSRNRYLSPREREEAVKIYQALYLGRELVEQRIMTRAGPLLQRLSAILAGIPRGRIEYLSIVDPETLQPMRRIRRPALLATAVRIGRTRLIDHVIIP